MARAEVHAEPRSLNERIFEAIPLPPLWIGMVLAGLMLALFFVMVYSTGQLERFMESDALWWQNRDGRIGVIIVLLAAYVVTARRYLTLGTRRNLIELRRSGIPATELEKQGHLDPSQLRFVGICALTVVPLIALAVDRDPTLYFQGYYWGGSQVWTWLLGTFTSWNVFVLFAEILIYGRRFSSLAERIPEIDLFDLSLLQPFAKQALRSVLPGLIMLSLMSINLVDQGFLMAVGIISILGFTMAIAGLLLPTRGVHVRIREAKQQELLNVNAALRGNPAELAQTQVREWRGKLNLADLLAYRDHVASLREWPFDTSTRVRFLLYLALPLGSWLGGAAVERLVDVFLA